MYFNFYDAAQRIGGWFRLGDQVNEGHAEMTCRYLPDGAVVCMYRRPEIPHHQAFAAGGLCFGGTEPFARLSVRYRGEVLSLIPLRNRCTLADDRELPTRITEHRCNGRVGYGLAEYLDQVADGRPVGSDA